MAWPKLPQFEVLSETGQGRPRRPLGEALAAAHATNDYLMNLTGLLDVGALRWTKHCWREALSHSRCPALIRPAQNAAQ